MNIACTIDDRFTRQCATMLRSLRQSNPDTHCHVYLLHDGIAPQMLDVLSGDLRGFLDNVQPVQLDTAALRDFHIDGHISLATYFRLLLPSALPPSVDRVLFLDCDLLVVDSLSPLWSLEMAGAPLAAVESPNPLQHVERLLLAAGEHYFNAGVLLIDLERWRARDVLGEAKDFYVRHRERVRWHDQDLLNQLFRGQWHRLSPRWNALPQLWSPDDSFRGHIPRCPPSLAGVGGPAIVHFAGGGACKPWNYHCRHPYRDDYRRLAAATPWGCGRLDDAPTLTSRVKQVVRPLLGPIRGLLKQK